MKITNINNVKNTLVRSVVIAPARTGKDRSKRSAVISTDQTNNRPTDLVFIIVVIKFTFPKIEKITAK